MKLENILLEKDEEETKQTVTYENLKICDFGSSRKIMRDQYDNVMPFDPIDLKGFVPATPYYMAPEMLDQAPYSHKADIWSCGIIAFILLSGMPPFKGQHDADIAETIRNNSKNGPPMDDMFWKSVSTECKAFVRELLTYDPE